MTTNNAPQAQGSRRRPLSPNDHCIGADDEERFGEYGLVDAIQKDESHLDSRFREETNNKGSEDDDDDDEETVLVNGVSDGEKEDETELGHRGRIRFSTKKLYGREEELERLKGLFKGMLEQPLVQDDGIDNNHIEERSSNYCNDITKTVFVSGFSGSGKSALVQTFVADVRKSAVRMTGSQCHDQVLFLHAKYEKTQSSAPFSAFSTLFDQIPLSLTKEFRHVYSALHDSLGDDVDVLRRIFPQLTYLFFGQRSRSFSQDDDHSISSSQNSATGIAKPRILERQQSRVVNKARLKFAISALFRALCDNLDNRPLILYVDDLQWADQSGLELLETLISDDMLQYLFFIGAYRSNEIGGNSYFANTIGTIEGRVATETLQMGEMSLHATGEFISDSLDLSINEVEPLTKAVFAKSFGNPLHTRQALEHLVRRNALYYDNMIFSWSWNLGADGTKNTDSTTKYLEDLLADDILAMVKAKIEHMRNAEFRRILAVASLVRSTFDVDTLSDVLRFIDNASISRNHKSSCDTTTNDNNQAFSLKKKLLQALDGAIDEGLLTRIPCTSKRVDGSDTTRTLTYAFSHDRVQEAAATFIPKDAAERDLFLVNLGMGLLHRARSESSEDWMYFAAARHLNTVSILSQPTNQSLVLEVAKLNIETAQLSLCLLAFEDAGKYVKHGLSLLSALEGDRWEAHYDLTMELHSIGAQAELGAGNPLGAESHCKTILNKKKDTVSAMPAYKVHLDILGGEGDHSGALQLILSVLEELGVKIPRTKRGKRLKAWMVLQHIKAGNLPTKDRIQNMPFVSDPRAAAIMELIRKAVRFAIAVDLELYILLCCEGIRWLNRFGLSETSGASTASFANVVTHKFGDFKTGVRLAELAIFMVDRQNNKFTETQALNTANQNVLSWVRPIKSRLPYHVRAYESGMTSGNIEGACVGKWHIFWNLYHSSAPLAVLEEDMSLMIKKVNKWGFTFFKSFYSVLWQLVHNLTGKSDNTTLLVGHAMNEEDEIWHKMPHKALLATFKSYAMVVFGAFESAATDALERGNSYTENTPGMQYGMEPFHRGISLYVMARQSGETKYKTAARQVRKVYQMWVKKGCINLVGLLKLLDAEDLALRGKKNVACKKYDDAVATLVRGGFYCNAGVACERFGHHLAEIGQQDALRGKLEQAITYYSCWGAKRKVELLREKLENLQ